MSELNPFASPLAADTGELIHAECRGGFIWRGFIDQYEFQVAHAENLAQRIIDFYQAVGFRLLEQGPTLRFRRGHLWGSLIGSESHARQTLCVDIKQRTKEAILVTLHYDVDLYLAIRYQPKWTLAPFREAVRLARTLDAVNWD